MNEKKQMLTILQAEFDAWEALLAGLSETQIEAAQLPAGLSVKNVVAHLMAWQQRSIARLEAARQGGEPVYPDWPAGLDPESEQDLDRINAWILATYRDQSWRSIHQAWLEGFTRFLELAREIPEKDLLERGRYAWLGEYTLMDVLQGSYDHHHEEHLQPLREWLRNNQ